MILVTGCSGGKWSKNAYENSVYDGEDTDVFLCLAESERSIRNRLILLSPNCKVDDRYHVGDIEGERC